MPDLFLIPVSPYDISSKIKCLLSSVVLFVQTEHHTWCNAKFNFKVEKGAGCELRLFNLTYIYHKY